MSTETAAFPPLQLAVVIPTLNESGNVVALLQALDAALSGIAWEALFVDDGSTDGTPTIIQDIARRRRDVRLLRRFGRRGLSSAVIEGMLATTAPIVAVIDADLQHDESVLPALYRAVHEGRADLAVGTRYTEGGSVGDWAKSRVRASAIATRLAQMLMKTPLSDPMSGFFVIRQDRIIEILPRLSTVGFKILLDIVVSSPDRLRVAEVPYRFRNRLAGASKLDTTVAFEFLLLLLEKTVGRWIPPRFILFATVGGIGLIAHLILLKLMLSVAGQSFAHAQMVAVTLTIALNFALNNLLTYRDRRLRGWALWRGLATFYVICGAGAIANVGVGELVYSRHTTWWFAGFAGAAIGAVWNYAASSFLTWKRI